MSITLLIDPAELARLVELDMLERRRLCDPVAIARGYAALERIAAAMKAKRAGKPLVVYVTPDMVSTSKSTPGIDIKHSAGVEIRVKGAPLQLPLPLGTDAEAA